MKKLAIIGCGGIGKYHLGHFLNFGDIIELVGFCDLIPERAESFVDKAGCGKAFTDYRVMYDEVKPDMVFICIPPYCHGEVEFETIRRGIPFFVEKPVALDLDLACEIRDRAAAAGLITAVGFQCRYSSICAPTIDFCRNNTITYVEMTRMGGVPGVFWWRDKTLSGGQVVEQTIHDFDIVRYCFDEPTEVFTFGARGFIDMENYNTDDLSTTVVRFKSGAIGCFATGCYAKSGNACEHRVLFSAADKRAEHRILSRVEIFGETAEKKADGGGFVIGGDGGMAEATGNSLIYKATNDAGTECDRTFIEAVISGDGSKIRSPYADAVKTLEFVLACNKSMETKAPVSLKLN